MTATIISAGGYSSDPDPFPYAASVRGVDVAVGCEESTAETNAFDGKCK